MRRSVAVLLVLLTPLAVSSCGGPSGYEGPHLRFDGDADHASLGRVSPADPLCLAGSTFTLAAWFLQEPGGDLYQRIVDKSDAPFGHNGWALAADGASGQIHVYSHDGTDGGDFVSRRGRYTTGRWHHVAAVSRKDRFEIWIDGRKDGGAFFEAGVHTLPAAAEAEARIGTWNHGSEREWKGLLGEVVVWQRDLEPDEIEEIAAAAGSWDYREDRGAYRGASDLVGYWPMAFDPRDPGQILDLSPSGAHARWVDPGKDPRLR